MQFIYPDAEPVRARAWTRPQKPRKALCIRLHAMGDVALCLPAVQHFSENNPDTELHFLVCERNAALVQNMAVVSKVHRLPDTYTGAWNSARALLTLLPGLRRERFDVVLDLQNNRFSRALRIALQPEAWCSFDRFSKKNPLFRSSDTLNAIGLGTVEPDRLPVLRDTQSGMELLRRAGWNGRDTLVVLNPCGLFPTRQWGTEKYLAFARLWLEQVSPDTKFLILGIPSLREKAAFLAQNLGKHCFDLTGQTALPEALNILRHASLTLSDDGGLLHLSYSHHIPTIGFLGASPSYWAAPVGAHTHCFNSADLPCGNCHRTECLWSDNRCLTRVSPEMALEQAVRLVFGKPDE